LLLRNARSAFADQSAQWDRRVEVEIQYAGICDFIPA
jgi:hypothetical protein